MTLQRTAGPLGRALGFALTIGKLSVSFNAGWYVLFLNWRGSWYLNLSTAPIRVDWYVAGVSQ